MDNYCIPTNNGKIPAITPNIITLGKESCTSVASLLAYRNEYPNNAKCEITIKSPTGYGLIAFLKYASFRPVLLCNSEKDELSIVLNKTIQHNITASGKLSDLYTELADNDISVRFSTIDMKEKTFGRGFEMIFTVYRAVETSGECLDGYFKCENSRCVHRALHCDKTDNCGNNMDEVGCDYGVSSIWFMLAIAGWLVVGFIVIAIFICIAYQKYFIY